jgi:hypothetical protein
MKKINSTYYKKDYYDSVPKLVKELKKVNIENFETIAEKENLLDNQIKPKNNNFMDNDFNSEKLHKIMHGESQLAAGLLRKETALLRRRL